MERIRPMQWRLVKKGRFFIDLDLTAFGLAYEHSYGLLRGILITFLYFGWVDKRKESMVKRDV